MAGVARGLSSRWQARRAAWGVGREASRASLEPGSDAEIVLAHLPAFLADPLETLEQVLARRLALPRRPCPFTIRPLPRANATALRSLELNDRRRLPFFPCDLHDERVAPLGRCHHSATRRSTTIAPKRSAR